MAAKERRQGLERVLGKLKASIENGDYYEAHQMYRTLYFRFLGQKKYDELLNLLYDGAVLFLKHKQHTSGSDLASLYVDVLTKSGTPVSDSYLDKLGGLYSLMEADSPERLSFLSAALRWSSQGGEGCQRGHPKLHQQIAITLWKEKNYVQSRYHFVHSMDGIGCASMLVEFHINKGYPSEVELFIAQVVFQYLCLKNKSTATVAFYAYTEKHPSVNKGPPFLLPLLNFLWFLLLAIESGKLAYFTVLCEQYQPSINRDPTYPEYLDKIGQIFFGLPPPPPKQRGLFGNLLNSLLDDWGEEDTSDQSALPSTSRTMQQEELD